MKKLLAVLLTLYCAPALAQSAITLPIAANAVADIGNGPIKVRMIAGNASIFTSQGSGTGSTSGSSTALTLTATPATPPIVGGLISGAGITSGTTVAAYNGTTGITLSVAMTVPGGTALAWGAACPSSVGSAPAIQASPQADYFIMYTQARVCAISPGGPVNTLLIEPVYYDQTTTGGGGGSGAVDSVNNSDGTLTIAPNTGVITASIALGHANTWTAAQAFPNNSLTLAEFPTIGANTVLGSVAGGTPAALTQTQLTSLINSATASLPGALPAWPNDTTKFFRGDGTYATVTVGGVTVGTTTIGNGTDLRVLYDDAGVLGEYTAAQLTAAISLATASLPGALPAWPGSTTTFFRGDGSYDTLNFAALSGSATCAQLPALTGDITSSNCATTLATVNTNVGSWGSAAQIPTFTVNAKGLITAAGQAALVYGAGSLTGSTLAAGVTGSSLISVGVLGGGSADTGFTIVANDVTWSGAVPIANLPVATTSTLGMVKPDNSTIMISAGVISAPGSGGGTVSSCPQYSVGAWTGAGSTTTINCVAAAASSVLVTDASKVPSLSTSLPAAIGINGSTATWSGTIPGANLQASNLAASGNGGVTGNLPAGNLNSGTGASAASFWRGDATWVPVGGPSDITNCTLAASVSGNALTVSLKTQVGADPSVAAPCLISFPNLAGVYTSIEATAAISFSTGTSGSTFGSVNATPFRLWITAWDIGGTDIALGVSKQSTATTIYPLNEGLAQTSTACSACTDATSSGVFYTTVARISDTIRILGYMDWSSGLTTAGTWASGPTSIVLMSPGVHKPGAIIQTFYSSAFTTKFSTTSSTYQSTPVTGSLTVTSAPNLVRATATGNISDVAQGTTSALIQFFRSSTAIGNALYLFGSAGGDQTAPATLIVLDQPGAAGSTTYTVKLKNTDNVTSVVFPDKTPAGSGGTIMLEEIQG